MSRRRIRRSRRAAAGAANGPILYGSHYYVRDPETGAFDIVGEHYPVEPDVAAAQPLYSRAHRLMPLPRSPFFDPFELAAMVPAAAAFLRDAGDDADDDDVLLALGVLGHTPTDVSLSALFDFVSQRPHGDLSRVAQLAILECTAIGRTFGLFDAAS